MTTNRASSRTAVGAMAQLPTALLKPWPENPRTISEARLTDLKRSLVEDREMLEARPLIALPDGTVILGNQRLQIALELDWKTIPVITVDLTPERARLWALRDNNSYGEWDEPALANMLAELKADGVDLALAGFPSGDVDRILAGIELPADPDDAPPPPDTPPTHSPARSTSSGRTSSCAATRPTPRGLERLLYRCCRSCSGLTLPMASRMSVRPRKR